MNIYAVLLWDNMKEFFTSATPLNVTPREIIGKTKIINKTKHGYKLARRIPKEGYPKTTKFTDAKEIYDYLHGEKITCLMCGRSFKQLCAHLSKIHKIKADEYKEAYGLPFRCGLSSEPTKAIYRENGSKPRQIAHLKTIRTPEAREKCMVAVKTQRNSDLKKIISRARFQEIVHPGSPFDASHGEAVLSYMEKHDCSIAKALRDTNIMKKTAFINLIKCHPELKAEERIKSGSRGVRSPMKNNPDVLAKIKTLREEGKGFKEIGVMLGIHEEYASFLARGATRKTSVSKGHNPAISGLSG